MCEGDYEERENRVQAGWLAREFECEVSDTSHTLPPALADCNRTKADGVAKWYRERKDAPAGEPQSDAPPQTLREKAEAVVDPVERAACVMYAEQKEQGGEPSESHIANALGIKRKTRRGGRDVDRFTRETAAVSGRGERSVQRDARRLSFERSA